MTKILWTSRHEMTAEQKKDLEALLEDEVEVVASENILWAASADVRADLDANIAIWKTLDQRADHLCGVFPPVAAEALPFADIKAAIWSPVSAQSKELRADGSTQIAFKHLRWAGINAGGRQDGKWRRG